MTPNPPILEVRDLSVHYGGVVARDAFDLDVAPGEVVGLIGPNGAGKTTCIDALTGFTRPTRGAVHFDGRSLDGVSPHDRARRGFTRTFQSLELFDDLTVRQNLLVAATTPSWRSTLTDALRPKGHADEGADEVLDLLGLSDVAERSPAELSNGPRHLIALGRALVAGPRLVLVDEPAAGLDPAETSALGATIRTLPERGTAVLLVDHDMGLVFSACDRIHVLDFGRRIASGAPDEVRADAAVRAAYLGEDGQT